MNEYEENIKPNVYAKICPSREILAMVGEKWSVLILYGLSQNSVMRFGELKQLCEGISQKMLSQTLKKLERDGLLSRTVYGEKMPLRVEYTLTDLGETIVPVLQRLIAWSECNLSEIEACRRQFDLK